MEDIGEEWFQKEGVVMCNKCRVEVRKDKNWKGYYELGNLDIIIGFCQSSSDSISQIIVV